MSTTEPLSLLLLEDSAFDVELVLETLRAVHPQARCTVVRDEAAFRQALRGQRFDAVLSDYQIPGFGGDRALDIARQLAPQLPFIFVSGVIGEDNAVELLKRGATDYVSKSRLERLPLVLSRALRETAERAARDAAERGLRVAKEQAEAARHEAEQASRSKDRFIAMLSHELRAPLAAVSSAVHLLERYAVLPAQHQGLVSLVRRNIAVEARLIDDLLDISAIASGKLGIKPQAVDMHAVLHDALQMLAEPLQEQGMQLHVDFASGPAWVHGDPVRLQQIIANLVRNAIKFSDPGGVVRLQTVLEDGHFVFHCCDHGIGIAGDALARIFSAFEQAEREAAHQRGGLGLGLAIAQHLALAHGGLLLADSDGLGQGARFTLSLPLQQGAVPPPPAAAIEPPAACGARVLLVEDHPGAAQVLRMCLEDYGYAVEHAGTVAEALRLARSQPFDIVLTDLGLPDGSGVDVGRALSGRWPVVALSGYGAETDLRSTAEAGFASHLVKPVEPAQVHAVLQKVLLEHQAP